MKEQIFIIDNSTVVKLTGPYKTGGHGQESEQRSMTFSGDSKQEVNTVRISVIDKDLREEIVKTWEKIRPRTVKTPSRTPKTQDI